VLHPLAGKPLIRYVVDRVLGLCDECIVVVAKNSPKDSYRQILPGLVEVINDELEGKSPLVGMVTALRASKAHFAVVLTCDIPFVNRRVIQMLIERSLAADATVPRWNSGLLEPLEAIYRRNPVLRATEEALARGQLSPLDVINRLVHVQYVSIEDEVRPIDPEFRTFFNVNTRDDLAKAETILRQYPELRQP
jgi:molybdopterin-guanine dinucleotide biosynthesis protein A